MLSDQRWKVDKHIPVALIIMMAGQTFGFGWWAATTTERIGALERDSAARAPISERLVKLETKFDAAVDTLQEIKAILRQVPTRAAP